MLCLILDVEYEQTQFDVLLVDSQRSASLPFFPMSHQDERYGYGYTVVSHAHDEHCIGLIVIQRSQIKTVRRPLPYLLHQRPYRQFTAHLVELVGPFRHLVDTLLVHIATALQGGHLEVSTRHGDACQSGGESAAEI